MAHSQGQFLGPLCCVVQRPGHAVVSPARNTALVHESNTPVLPVQHNSTLYFHYFRTLSFFRVTVPLSQVFPCISET
ncbi:hypothetical protein XELAEV_18025438mg [Xenopus laevis]|uniref:Uncharacterized protein n=1 Tax=Xenopus laevis TaxID=8355 RepID=A0A974D0R8_XENLA|nr:hypothetical protein XELAEV_18025438mg [Xenopus laevis]